MKRAKIFSNYIVALLSLFSVSVLAGEFPPVPSAYTNFTFPEGMDKGFSEITFKTTVLTDPGRNAFVYWANNWDGGYTGLQATGFGKGRIFLFSIWGATDAREGSPGSSCGLFSHEGSGASCSINHDWVEGYTYKQHLKIENQWATLTVTEEDTGKSFVIGSIKLKGNTLPATFLSSWTEYVEWNNPKSVCENQPYASVHFAIPSTDFDKKLKIKDVSNGKYCSQHTTVTYDDKGSTQKTNIGNSVRGSIIGMDNLLVSAKELSVGSPVVLNSDYGTISLKNFQRCVDVSGGKIAPGTLVQIYYCNSTPAQLWKDDSQIKNLVNMKSNRCLSPVTDAINSAINISDCNGSELQKWDFIDNTYKNSASGLCLDVTDGAIKPESKLQLYTCNSTAAQKFVNLPGLQTNQWVLARDKTIRTVSNYCLAVAGNNATAGSTVEIQECTAGSQQKWDVSNNTVTHIASDLCLDVKDAKAVEGAPLQIWHCNNTVTQQWTVPKIIQ